MSNTNNPIDFPKIVDKFVNPASIPTAYLKHRRGNILDMAEANEFDIVVHGCNCYHAMSGGIAREIAQRYPQAEEADNATQPGSIDKIGTFSHTVIQRNANDAWWLVNAYTQYTPSRGVDVFEYLAFELLLYKWKKWLPAERWAFPFIGMGLAMGDPERIIPMLDNFAKEIESTGGSVTLVEFQP
jgi:O-acetyl-ADP-ribose deacetylase (regulator of RNase III)